MNIRTSDGIIYENALQMIDKNWQVKTKSGRYIKVSNNLILKTADNVEELFDYKICGGRVYPNSVDIDYIYNDFGDMFFGDPIYGAIMTEKGIIKVAKYKLGGEWELL